MELSSLSAIERIQWGDERFEEGLHGMISGGRHSGVLSALIEKAGLSIEEELINTGNLFPESIEYAREVSALHGHRLNITTSRWGELTDEEAQKRYDEDSELYKQVTKLEPLSRIIAKRGITAFLSGVRAGQNENRAGLGFIRLGRDGKYRIHPIYDWTDGQVESFIKEESVPEHPMTDYGSIGDRITTVPGEGREGRLLEKSECGLHLLATPQQIALQTS